MASGQALRMWFRSPTNLIAGGLVLGGFVLAAIDWGFIALAAVGTFGPGILRELGWLRDKDEFELRAARRAGYHAYLAGGLMVFLLVAAYRSLEGPDESPTPLDYPSALMTAVLVVMWFTWLLSSLLSYWGPLKTARRILFAFGAVWLVFNILGNLTDPLALFMQSLLAVPFFAAAWAAPRWPRVAGVVLLAASVFFFGQFDLDEVFTDPLAMGRIPVLVLFLGPLFASGLALLSGGGRDHDEEI